MGWAPARIYDFSDGRPRAGRKEPGREIAIFTRISQAVYTVLQRINTCEIVQTPAPQDIVHRMMKQDAFSQWLGIEVLEAKAGFCRLALNIHPRMVNGFGIAHGGIAFSLADSALAFASNGHGRQALSVRTSMSHLAPLRVGDRIVATARELNLARRIGHYEVDVRREDGELVARFEGTVYRTSTHWLPEEED